ncbi:hypothetical protein CDV31_006479 [Fusarium ambrosium]|uniref:Fibronectin type III-like domain-containing protein n=1 Tax=Fusarium ambrosium TaxID=131363 RepID=A0A428UCJ9_9HYPO|nr:hypothetical protein CDV31_006479 [Fusarium ambrosium]
MHFWVDMFTADDEFQYPFGYGLSYTAFSQSLESAESTAEGRKKGTFSHGDTISFSLSITNTANKQLVAFNRLYVEASETITNDLELEVDRYLPLVNREYDRVLEAGDYVFLLSDDGSLDSPVLAKTALGVETSHKY